MSSALELVGLRLAYQGSVVLAGVNLVVPAGRLAVITGVSGAGKTTLLEIIAGERLPDTGTVRLGGRTLVDDDDVFVAAKKRPVALVAQGGGLLVEKNAGANIALALPRRERATQAGAAKVAGMFDLLGMPDEIAGRKPPQLSLGQRQQVALARGLIARPELLLLDEPFFALDPATRAQLRDNIVRAVREAGTTAVLVTHDADEAARLGDHRWSLSAGRLRQVT